MLAGDMVYFVVGNKGSAGMKNFPSEKGSVKQTNLGQTSGGRWSGERFTKEFAF